MRCEERVRLVRNYLGRVREYSAAVRESGHATGIPMVEYELVFAVAEAARSLAEEAHRLLQQHVAQHHC